MNNRKQRRTKPFNNVVGICDECAEEKLKKFQEENSGLVLKPGDYAKVKFTEGDKGEHMWIRVQARDANTNTYIGILDNDPVDLTNVVCGEQVLFEFEEIEQVIIN